jgi:hypothetical protein
VQKRAMRGHVHVNQIVRVGVGRHPVQRLPQTALVKLPYLANVAFLPPQVNRILCRQLLSCEYPFLILLFDHAVGFLA